MSVTNADIGELLWRESEAAEGQRRYALRRAAGAALHLWPLEAADVARSGAPLTSLAYVGPRIAARIERWLAAPPEVPQPPPTRRGYRTRADAVRVLRRDPAWASRYRGDLQVHTTFSDGRATLAQMTEAAAERGHEYVAITDHTKGLPIAGGKDEAAFASQAAEIAARNAELGGRLRVLRGVEMNLDSAGRGDVEPSFLRTLDVVLGAFHSRLREREDQTERYLAALRNPDVHVLAHPRNRMLSRRVGLEADWRRVATAAADLDKALEIDATPARQDLDVETLAVVREARCRVAIDTDSHSVMELQFVEFGLAAALEAGIPAERIVNFLPVEDLLAWTGSLRERAARSGTVDAPPPSRA
jgi:DNA polymerase (family 10)